MFFCFYFQILLLENCPMFISNLYSKKYFILKVYKKIFLKFVCKNFMFFYSILFDAYV